MFFRDAAIPPLIEWLRVIEACTSQRRSSVCEKEDVTESARILLPGFDYPPRLLGLNSELQYFQAIGKLRLLNEFNQEVNYLIIFGASNYFPTKCYSVHNYGALQMVRLITFWCV